MSGTNGICGTHAPRPHNEFVCHATGERRQNIINEIKMLLDKVDDRPCIIPDLRPETEGKRSPIIKYPGYVDKRHEVFQPPEPPPLITSIATQELRPTSEPSRVADDPPNVCYQLRQYKPRDQGRAAREERSNSREIRGGVMYSNCECVRRNGLQDQCPRRECGGKPECVALNPGPCCQPALANLASQVESVYVPKQNDKELCKTNKAVMVCCRCHQC